MLELNNSDLFVEHIDKDKQISGKINTLIHGGDPTAVILNSYVFDEIKKKIIETHKERVTAEIGNEIMKGGLILIYQTPDKKISDMVPFFAFIQNGVKKVGINMSSITRIIKGPDKNPISYEITDIMKAYSLLYGGYLYLKKFESDAELSPSLLYNSAVVWASMFNKPIFDAFGMSNPERNEAFNYFAIKFFLLYIMECNEDQADRISGKYIKNKKNDMILYMEDQINRLGLKPFSGMVPFMTMLFNNEVTQIKGVRVANVLNQMNTSFYIQKFITTYGSSALLSLCTMPYFAYVVIAAYQKSHLVNDKAYDRIFSIYKREANAMVVELNRE